MILTLFKRSFSISWRQILPYLICALIIVVQVTIFTPAKLNRLENFFLDSFFRMRPALHTDPRIVFIDISEDSLQAFGRWPWNRDIHAVMVHILTQWHAKAILFDIVFSEASSEASDGAFEEALKEASQSSTKVYLPVILEPWGEKFFWIKCLPRFEQYASGIGHIHVTPDQDGLIRRIRPHISYAHQTYPHMAIKFTADLLKEEKQVFDFSVVPLDYQHDLMINWAGKWGKSFKHYSYVDIMKSFQALQKLQRPLIAPENIRDKICIIGLTATGLIDIKAAPIESAYPAAGVHGNIINSFTTHQFVYPVARWINTLVLIVIGVIACLLFLPFRNLISFAGGILLVLGWALISFGAFLAHGVWLYMFQHLMLVLVLFIFSAMYSFFFVSKERSHFLELAIRDGLTGLYLIRYFRQQLNDAIGQPLETRKNLSIILMDIDDFKKCNDLYGHQMGDEVLRTVAKIIGSCQKVFSSSESMHEYLAARYGGEEMIVMIKGTENANLAYKMAEWIRAEVEKTKIIFQGTTIGVTLSLGVSHLLEGETDPEAVIRRADEALYMSKHTGKNRTTVWAGSIQKK